MRWMNHRCTITFHDPPPFDIKKHVISDVCAGLKPAGLGGIIESPQVATEMAMWPTWKRQLFSKTKNWIQNWKCETLRCFIIHIIECKFNTKDVCDSQFWGIQHLKFSGPKTLPPLAGRTLWMRKSMASSIRGWWRLINFGDRNRGTDTTRGWRHRPWMRTWKT